MKFSAFSKEFEIDEDLLAERKVEIRRQLEEYFSGDRSSLDLEVYFPDSFTGDVMREISKIPYGETKTYGDIAEILDSSAIAVGQACGRNPIPLIVPCHRIVGKNSIGGYAYGKEIKEKLISFEK